MKVLEFTEKLNAKGVEILKLTKEKEERERKSSRTHRGSEV
jgi:hypothetical protein